MKISSEELTRKKRVNEDIHMQYSAIKLHLWPWAGQVMVSLKWGKVTVIVVLPQD